MITLHTLENSYDDGNLYHQFVQTGRQSLLESTALGYRDTLHELLLREVIGDLGEQDPRIDRLLKAALDAGDIKKLLDYAMRCNLRDYPKNQKHGCDTYFGEWTFDSVVLQEPTLRERQENVWTSDPVWSRQEWKDEVREDATHIGYWEWVESQREQAENEAKKS